MYLDIERLKGKNQAANHLYAPVFFQLNNQQDITTLNTLIENGEVTFVHDEINSQIAELIKIRNPQQRIQDELYPEMIEKHLNGTEPEKYGIWVFYPWSQKLVHLLPETEFIEVRTSRNQHKITLEEQEELQSKKIGIIGLSVGQSIALTLAMERACGELRLADFDTAELSNLNRIRTGVQNLGIYKVILAAREIAEIDPFLKVRIFPEGLQDSNMDDFFSKNGQLDLLVEVCDGIDMKIASRFKARELQIPVVMDTNDRGMLDIERFDLEPGRAILHGLAGSLTPESVKTVSEGERLGHILKMVGADTLSPRMKASMMEMGQTIGTWPQLASSVVLGGAITTDVCRRILLDQFHESGRYYVDVERLVCDSKEAKNSIHFNTDLISEDALGIYQEDIAKNGFVQLDENYTEQLIAYSKEQNIIFKRFPFSIQIKEDKLFVFVKRAEILGLQYLAILGGMLASFNHKLRTDGKDIRAEIISSSEKQQYYVIGFKAHANDETLPHYENIAELLQKENIPVHWAADAGNAIDALAACERLLHFLPVTHKFHYNYIRFSSHGEGVAYEKTGLPPMAKPVYLMASDPAAIQYVGKWKKGNVLNLLAKMRWSAYNNIGVIVANNTDYKRLIEIGGHLQSLVWNAAADKFAVNDSVAEFLKTKDFPEIYGTFNPLKESLITNFQADLDNAIFICGVKSN